jgi:serine-type D-Ala-D-Ala carboxypeptidase/endopeptidase
VLANAVTQTGIEDIGFHLIDPKSTLAPQHQPRQAISIDPTVLQDYVGTYELGPEFSITVTAQGNQLFIQASGQTRLAAFPETESDFFIREVDAQISFTRDEDGVVTGLELHQNGQTIPGQRK